ncbi:unconventional myosin-IXa-like isoform X3 [Arctopsyche grandis]|uniref:unconventional myosin-IXa-like isoform X3 n=1 Tax=Arctopsyche grandis TaxID=121162 RepID=UPI00406D93C8
MALVENNRYIVQVFVGALSAQYEALSVEASKQTSSEEIVSCIADKLNLTDASGGTYELAEVVGDVVGGECKERRLGASESPVAVMLLWPHTTSGQYYRFYLREKMTMDVLWMKNFSMDPQLIKDYFQRFLYQPKDREYPDLCQLPDLNEQTLLDNLRARFSAGYIYTYVGSILIAVNPFKFHPIYNPKYVKLYQNKRIGSSLPPHIFAVADTAYHCMLKEKTNQCIVISGESGSGKTESTNFLLHHLTALSQKGSHGSGVEQTILSAGPVLEAFGNAKTAHNNNSSRFGKFIQVNYKENGMVHGAVVQKYLLEKSRICSQGRNERNYHVFYYLLAGASEQEKQQLHLLVPEKYNYLSRSGCCVLQNIDEKHEFSRLKQSMEMVGFMPDKQRRLFGVLSAVLLLGNVEFQPRKSYHHDEAVGVKNPEVVGLISELLRVKQETLMAALTAKRARVSGETLIINYRLPEAVAARDAMAKCLYGALFDWIVMQVNHALLSKKDTLREHQGHSIGVLDIFGFEDFGPFNSFEQLCINYANEHLQYYFNQHVFKYEQEEYRREGIRWTDIGFLDNTGCLQLIEGKPGGLLCVLDDQCNFPGATNETLLQKFNTVHKENIFYEKPQRREPAFIVKHYAGKVKYQVTEMREKNLDLMRQDIVGVLKNSSLAFVRELVGADPVAVFRWAIVRAFFRGYFAFQEAGRKHRICRADGTNRSSRSSIHTPNEMLIRKNKSFRPRDRGKKGLKNLQSVKTLAGRTGASLTSGTGSTTSTGSGGKARKQPLTVAAQFQHSLHSLMDTLNQANPFFIRCIKSNGEKIPNAFDDETVQRQLRYTGMLETVRIRQAGYNVRLTYEEFIQLYRILLPKGLLSSQNDVRHFLATLNLNRDNYQLGCTKIFMRESEQTKLDFRLHQQIMASIITIQRWCRAILERRRFLTLRRATVIVQQYCRDWMRLRQDAAVKVQAFWKGARVKKWFQKLKNDVVVIQAFSRGYLIRNKIKALRKTMRREVTTVRVPVIEKIKTTIPELTELPIQRSSAKIEIQKNESDVGRALRPTQSLPSPRHSHSDDLSYESISDNLSSQSYCKKKVTKTLNTIDLSSKNLENRPKNFTDTDWSYPERIDFVKCPAPRSQNDLTNRFVVATNKITVEDMANELVHLQIDMSNLGSNNDVSSKRNLTSKEPSRLYNPLIDPYQEQLQNQSNQNIRLTESLSASHSSVNTASDSRSWSVEDYTDNIFTECLPSKRFSDQSKKKDKDRSREEFLNLEEVPIGDDVAPSGKKRASPQMYHRSLSTTVLDPSGRNLVSLPPIRRDPRTQDQSSVKRHSTNQAIMTNVTKPIPIENPVDLSYPKSQTKVPEPPVRNIRRKKEIVEETDSSKGDKSFRLSSDQPSNIKRARTTGIIGTEIKRRNSDPSALVPPPVSLTPQPPPSADPNMEFIGSTANGVFKIAGHRFRKWTRFSKDDRCIYCNNTMDAFVTQGQKCMDCKQLFHTKCIQNKGVFSMPCKSSGHVNAGVGGRGKHRKTQRASNQSGTDTKTSVTSKFSLTGTSEFTDRTDKIISDAKELQRMQDFIAKKIYKMENEERKQSEVDRLFKHALMEFKDNLLATYSVVNKQGSALKYKDLIANFLRVMETICHKGGQGETFPVTMGVNAFRGFMDEFMVSRHEVDKVSKTKKKKDKKRKVDDPILYAGHTFVLSMINIPTECEICKTFFMWPIERSLICQTCKLTSHKKCYLKVATHCRRDNSMLVMESGGGRVFGVPLFKLSTGDGKVPVVVDRLVTTIELYGLYTEGIYRKSGVSSKVKELKVLLDESPEDTVNLLEGYPVHVLTSVLKGFFREMPEPLLTFDFYDDFILAANLIDPQDRVATLFDILKKLPKPNFDLMERLIFHLARVALNEEANRMGPGALAIVFAPCILRTCKPLPAQVSLHHITNQTTCVETILIERLRTVRTTLADIATLESACHTATHRLSSLRCSKIFTPEELTIQQGSTIVPISGDIPPPPQNEEEALLVDHIQEIKKEKAILTSALPSLTRATSDDDLLSTDLDGESGSLDDLSQTPGKGSATSSGARIHKALHRQMSSDDPIMV